MGETKLPKPVTAEQLYLAAILDELRAQRGATAPQRPQETEVVELVEPKRKRGRPKKKKTV
ncbi:MAG: hypothetical protein V3V32_04430 [Dehalococcoidia bacterium]